MNPFIKHPMARGSAGAPSSCQRAMKLILFDIDGTLTRTDAVDGECFVQAFAGRVWLYRRQ